ncbi:hypothetical protein AB0E69_40225 [Kribbella sp. NPDC026611]|uniref:hypothetical protein n=1 Tax=Kribbella sp. NPDC026611 TaxID=3154911 RepID=UPI0033C017A4
MTGLGRWHVGPWTARGSLAGEPFEPAVKRTPDELNFDVVGLSRILGRRQSLPEEMLMRRCQGALRPTDPRPCGVETLPAELAGELAALASLAFAWIAERAPAGYRFVLTDAVELEPDPSSSVVPVESVSLGLPVGRVAAAHVRRSAAGDWYAGDAVCNWSGPHATADDAVDAVRRARAELVEELRAAGRSDLAETADRWPTVPVEPV